MPLVKVECFCSQKISTVEHKKLNDISPEEWVTLPACGHIFHKRCIRSWTLYSGTGLHPHCPHCRTSTKSTTIINGEGRKIRLLDVKLFFGDDLIRSDPASQLADFDEIENDDEEEVEVEEEVLVVEEEEIEDDNDVVARGGGNENVLREQLREMRNTLRDVKKQRDDLVEVKEKLLNVEEEMKFVKLHEEELEIQLVGLRSELGLAEHELEQYELGQPDLREEISTLEGQIEVLTDENMVQELEIDTLKKEILKQKLDFNELEDTTRMEKLDWSIQKKKLSDKINSEGSAGAARIRILTEEAVVLERTIFDLRCAKDRLEFLTKEELKKKGLECTTLLEEAKLEVEAAKRTTTLAERKADEANEKFLRIESANSNWSDKYEKLKQKYTKSQSKKGVLLSSSPPTPIYDNLNIQRSPIKKKNFSTEFSPLKIESPNRGFRIASRLAGNSIGKDKGKKRFREEDLEGDEEEEDMMGGRGGRRNNVHASGTSGSGNKRKEKFAEEEEDSGSDSDCIIVDNHSTSTFNNNRNRNNRGSSSEKEDNHFTTTKRNQSKPMTTLTSTNYNRIDSGLSSKSKNKIAVRAGGMLGNKLNGELSHLNSDKHLPDFNKGTITGITSKMKQRKV